VAGGLGANGAGGARAAFFGSDRLNRQFERLRPYLNPNEKWLETKEDFTVFDNEAVRIPPGLRLGKLAFAFVFG